MDVGPTTGASERAAAGEDAEDLLVFVERLAAAARADRATALAQQQVGAVIRAGSPPPGLRRLAEALAASMGELPPPPRQPIDDTSAIVPAMRSNPLVVLDDADPSAVASAVAALMADGRRVVVTADTDAELDAVRAGVPDGATLDRLPAMPPAELRELRRLLATSTAAGRARVGQQLPLATVFPTIADVDAWCRLALNAPATRDPLVPTLLADVEPDRREAVTSVARCVQRSLGNLGPRDERPWAWRLLGDLIHSRHRPVFDRAIEDIAQAVGLVERDRGAPAVEFVAPLTPDATDVLCRYLGFLESGGRSRSYFRASAQRDVQPVLRAIRVGGRVPESAHDIVLVLGRLELAERLRRVDAGCAEMGAPAPRGPEELAALGDRLGRVAAAARSVGALRHDVLFLSDDSPLSVPDVDTAAMIATAICEYEEHSSATDAADMLDRIADDLAGRAPAAATAPEHRQAVAALRARDAAAYAAAVDTLASARREQFDESRRIELLDRLRRECPELATAWEASGRSGLACFVRAAPLLAAMPAADSADVVVVLGAARLGVERLLLTAVAPRMIATVAPDDDPDGAPTLLSVLQRASALVIRGGATQPRTSGRVVQLSAARSAAAAAAAVGQVGA